MAIYAQTVAEFKAAAVAVNPSGRFDHGRTVDLSQQYDGDYPLIWLYPWNIQDPEDNGFLYRHPQMLVGFWELDKPHSSNEQRKEIIARMEVLKDAFITQLKSNNKIQVSSVVSEPLYQYHNGTVTGIGVKLVYQNFDPLCP
jgi:hypothetical protein